MPKIPIALELFSVREDLARDLRGTLAAVKRMGYDGVEFAGNPVNPAEEVRAILDELGLPCCSWHVPLELLQEPKLPETIAYMQTVGAKGLICPWLGGEWSGSRANWLKSAAYFNELAGKLAPHGMFTGYHNHHTEFTPLEGEWPWDTFYGNTDKAVTMQLDTGNALYGGADAVPILERYPGRSRTIHLKPYSRAAGKDAPEKGFNPLIGEDDIPWADVFRVAESTGGTEWYIVEYESDAFPPLEAVERCLKALRAMGK